MARRLPSTDDLRCSRVAIGKPQHHDCLVLLSILYIFLLMKTISVPIGQARTDFCRLIEKVNSGRIRVLVTDHGQPKAQILPFSEGSAPWRVAEPDDPRRYGDLQSPVMENWR